MTVVRRHPHRHRHVHLTVTTGERALPFNGTSQYVTFGAAPGLNTTDFTLETWFRRTGAGVGVTTGTGGIASPSRWSPRAAPKSRRRPTST